MPDDNPATTVVSKPSSRYQGYDRAYDFVTPRDLRKARKEAEQGRPGRFFEVLKFFDKIDHEIPAAMQSLTSAVLQEDIQVDAPENDEGQRQKAFAETLLEKIEVKELVKDLMKAHFFGFRAHWLEWGDLDHDGSTYKAPVRTHEVPMSWLHARKENRSDETTTLYVGDRPYEHYEAGSLILFSDGQLPTFEDLDFTEHGKGLAASRFGIFDWFDWEDWAAYNEAFATPSVLGTLLEGWNGKDKEILQKAVMNFTGDSRALITENGELDVLKPDGGGGASFDRLQKAAARARSCIIKSESLTSNMDDAGSYAAMQTTDGIRYGVAAGLARRIAKLLTRHVVQPAVLQSFSRCLVSVGLLVEIVEDLLQQLQIDRGLHRMGVPLSKAELRERYGRSAPIDEEDTLAPRRTGHSTNPFDRVTEN